MEQQCKSCHWWQGTNYSYEADCYKVIAVLQPALLEVRKNMGDETCDLYYYWDVPFDPHNIKFWNYNDVFMDLYRKAMMMKLPDGVKREIRLEQDIWMNQFGNERTKTVKVCYFKTHKTFNCEYFEENKNDS